MNLDLREIKLIEATILPIIEHLIDETNIDINARYNYSGFINVMDLKKLKQIYDDLDTFIKLYVRIKIENNNISSITLPYDYCTIYAIGSKNIFIDVSMLDMKKLNFREIMEFESEIYWIDSYNDEEIKAFKVTEYVRLFLSNIKLEKAIWKNEI